MPTPTSLPSPLLPRPAAVALAAALLGAVLAAPALAAPAAPSGGATATACPATLNHTFPRLQDEQPQSLCQYSGKVAVVVNTASYCGFTSQYQALEALYAKYKDQGLVVLGFPSNDFAQESGSNQQIAEFCSNTFGVKFPMFGKSNVTGPDASPFYKQLAAQAGGPPRWNFYKYLIGRDGRIVERFSSMTTPDSRSFVQAVEQQLAKR